jgi:hypothetical protein
MKKRRIHLLVKLDSAALVIQLHRLSGLFGAEGFHGFDFRGAAAG